MKEKILKIIEECSSKGYDDLHFKEDREYVANAIVENGNLISLPCNVGDKVYGINKNRYGFFIDELIIDNINIAKYKHDFNEIRIDIYIAERDEEHTISGTSFGETVFLTKAEAEKRLKEIQNER